MTSLVAMYEKGAITTDHFAVHCLQLIDPTNPALVFDALPAEILSRILDFVRRYRPEGMVTNYGVPPTTEQVEAAKRWIEESQVSLLGKKATSTGRI